MKSILLTFNFFLLTTILYGNECEEISILEEYILTPYIFEATILKVEIDNNQLNIKCEVNYRYKGEIESNIWITVESLNRLFQVNLILGDSSYENTLVGKQFMVFAYRNNSNKNLYTAGYCSRTVSIDSESFYLIRSGLYQLIGSFDKYRKSIWLSTQYVNRADLPSTIDNSQIELVKTKIANLGILTEENPLVFFKIYISVFGTIENICPYRAKQQVILQKFDIPLSVPVYEKENYNLQQNSLMNLIGSLRDWNPARLNGLEINCVALLRIEYLSDSDSLSISIE
ncbi:MAG: hypothetical protein WBA74_13760 [Cyclobacteriaceae bacterium]